MTAADICAPLREGTWSQGGVGVFTTGFSDPGGEVARIVSWALEYVSPLNEWLDELTGNEGEVTSFASAWRRIATDLAENRATLTTSAERVGELKGKTSRAIRKLHDEIGAVAQDTSEWGEATAAALELASAIVGAVHDAVVGALAELAGLIVDLFGFTLNPFDKINDLRRLSNRAIAFIEIIADLIQRMFDAFEELVALLRSLLPLIAEGMQLLREKLGILLREASPIVGGVTGVVTGAILGGPLGAIVGGVLGGAVTGILGGAASDLLAGDPRVTELNPADLGTQEQRDAYAEANNIDTIDEFSDLITMNGLVDTMGKQERGVIDIMQVVDGDTTRYVVSLPSTQDWGLLKGVFDDKTWNDMLAEYPPTNDLDSNVALMLMDNPWMATQYERAVMQAMSDAGVPAGAEVVYTGFSQGGIMAATLATSDHSPYTVVGIVTNGSPIGAFTIPPDIQVVRFEHESDPVPQLTFDPDWRKIGTGQPDAYTPPPANETLIVLPNPTVDGAVTTDVGEIHNNDNYESSVRLWEREHRDEIPSFFTGDVVDNQQHTWGE